ncbi:ketodeoxygluconokinase [Pseudoalteromonas sp. MM1]|uniref:sugar kinase n=1 Tax=Pseudoalteromonas sp. MM1 TaxID=3036714 RepID=UPI00257482AF|nr:sugar kinase [Pseudoalteromonas sp. MM1]BED89350.1 ketodeoxygluconokinase [Pseudoalteromonas sp. MM1]
MSTLLAIGECMVELVPKRVSECQQSFAGDTYNALVYAKRFAEQLNCELFSAVGEDILSINMLKKWQQEGISSKQVIKTPDHNVGIYAISTDQHGERSFDYWRNQSAAKHMMELYAKQPFDFGLGKNDWVFFSGISLAILEDDSKQQLVDLLTKLKAQGCIIAFDPNYRARMWQSKAHAIEWLERAYQISDVVLPGLDDHYTLFGHTNANDIVDYCQQFAIDEVVIKAGSKGMQVFCQNTLSAQCAFNPAPQQVDSTAAGDSFAGTYLAARMTHHEPQIALHMADKVASQVVQHQGAILPFDVYQALKLNSAK